MSRYNRSAKRQEQRKAGKMEFSGGIYFGNIIKNPELFYNSDEYLKIKNRKKGKK